MAVEAILAAEARSRVEVIRSIYRAYARSHGKDRYGDKTPNHVLHMQVLGALFPEVVFVHVIRDGRSVALALQEMSFGPSTAWEAASYWEERVKAGRVAGRELGGDRYLEVRYEELCSDPERVLRQVTAFIGLDYDAAMLEYQQATARQLEMSPAPGEDRSLLRPLTPGLRDWVSDMPARDVVAFERVAGSTLAALGYELGSSSTSAPAHLQGRLRGALEGLRCRWQERAGHRPVW